MTTIFGNNYNNIAAAGETPIYQRTGGGAGGGGNQILAQGRLYNTTYAIRSGAINFHQIGFNGPPVWGALGGSLEYIEWNFPGINTLDYIIKVVYGGYGYRGASGAEEWLILGDNIRLQWDADSGFGGVSFEYNQMDHYISVEASPF